MFGPLIAASVFDGIGEVMKAARKNAQFRVPDLTEEWLETPSAFWLHPEGPLSDTTREEWLGKEVMRLRERVSYAERRPQYSSYQPSQSSDYSMMAPIAILGALALSS